MDVKRTLIRGGRVIDPGHIDGLMDIIVENGKITSVDGGPTETRITPDETDRVIDASGKIVAPGLIDMHVHLREPGHEYKETILSGSRAAAAGGFTAVCAMPNTVPVNDSRQVTDYILRKASEANLIHVYPVASISKDLSGKQLSEYGELRDAGVFALSDDGRPVINGQLMRRAMEYARGFNLPIISHCEDLDLLADGVMNEGPVATRMGLAGISNPVESAMVMRDIALCELTGCPLHIAHVSTRESVYAIREGKNRGIPVTAETAPHYFTLTDESVQGYNTNAKMNPPLRSNEDREAVKEGLSDGTIDVIASDHAPHSSLEKEVEFDQAANGIIGLETSVSLSLKLVDERVLSLTGLIEKMAIHPARILGVENHLKVGDPADITILDLDRSYAIESNTFQSLSRNTPFEGWLVKGKAVLTMVDGRIAYEDL